MVNTFSHRVAKLALFTNHHRSSRVRGVFETGLANPSRDPRQQFGGEFISRLRKSFEGNFATRLYFVFQRNCLSEPEGLVVRLRSEIRSRPRHAVAAASNEKRGDSRDPRNLLSNSQSVTRPRRMYHIGRSRGILGIPYPTANPVRSLLVLSIDGRAIAP